MENFTRKIEKKGKLPSFITSTKDILKNIPLEMLNRIPINARMAVVFLVFSLGVYHTTEAQNTTIDNNKLIENADAWLNGNVSAKKAIGEIRNNLGNDSSYYSVNINEDSSTPLNKGTSGKNPFAEVIKIGKDTINLGNITVKTFAAGATESSKQNGKENVTEHWEFSSGVKKNTDGKSSEGGKTKTFTTKSFGDNPTEVLLSALGEMAESSEVHIFSGTQTKSENKGKDDKENYRNINVSSSENTFNMVKAVITPIPNSNNEYSVTVTYVD